MRGGLRFAVLGPVRAWRDEAELDLGQPQQRAVLAVLLMRQGAQVTLEELINSVWGDEAPTTVARVVRNYIYRLRQVLGRDDPDRIRSVGGGYALAAGPHLDLARFNSLAAQGRQARRDGDPAAAVAHFTEGLDLWAGTALAGLPGPYAAAQRTRLGELRLTVQEEHLACAIALGAYEVTAAELSAMVADHPLREQLRELQMHALYGAGRQAEALEVFGQASRQLRDDLGIDPGPGLRAIHQRILTADPSLLHPAPSLSPATMRSSAGPALAQLPADIAHFTGRDRELDALTTLAAKADTEVVITAIGGTAGIGKTALAIHWAHRAATSFPDGQLYVNLRGFDPAPAPQPPEAAVRGFLDALAVPPERIPASPDAQAALYRSLLAGKRLLIVLDNARDAAQVRPLLPGIPGCLVLVTSRNQLTSLAAADGARVLTLDLLTPGEAHDLLARRLGPQRVAAEPGATEELITLCARLPLALNITAARAGARPAFPLATFAAQLGQTRDRLAALDALAAGDATADVRAVFSWSYDALSPAAARTFRLLGLHPGPDATVPATASLTATGRDQASAALEELAAAHLLTEHSPGRYTFHGLLRAYAADQTRAHDTGEERHRAQHRMLDHYLHTAYAADRLLVPMWTNPVTMDLPQPGTAPEDLTDDQQAWHWLDAEHPVLLAAITQAAAQGFDLHACQLPWNLVTFLDRHAKWRDGLPVQEISLAAAERLGDPARQAVAHRNLGVFCGRLGADEDAHSHLHRALELYRQLGDHVGQGTSHGILAAALERQGRCREGLDHARQALELYGSAGHQVGQAWALNMVGWFSSLLGDHHQALDPCRRSLALHRSLGYQAGEAATLDSLGHAHHHLGHYREATDCYHQSVELYVKMRHRYDQADTLVHLGDTHHAAGDDDAARDTWEQAEAIFADLRDPEAEQVRVKLKTLT